MAANVKRFSLLLGLEYVDEGIWYTVSYDLVSP